MGNDSELLIRPARKSDIALILDSWMKSWRGRKEAGVIPNNLYFPTTRANIENLVARGSLFRVACLTSDEDAILGWICFERLKSGEDCIHYLYVKDPYLKMGIGQELVKQVERPEFYSYRFSQAQDFLRKAKWVPEIARRKE